MRALAVLGLLLAASLAGCAGGAPSSADSQAPAGPPDILHFHRTVGAPETAACLPAPCPVPEHELAVLALVPLDRIAKEAAVTVTPSRDIPALDWSLRCVPAASAEGLCSEPLAEGVGELRASAPLKASRAVDLPPGTLILFQWAAQAPPMGAPFESAMDTAFQDERSLSVTGHLVLHESDLPTELRWSPLALEGTSGPCMPQEKDCASWPGGSEFELPVRPGILTAVNLTVTWDAAAPAVDSRLVVTVECQRAARPEGMCADDGVEFTFEGESPLHVAIDPFWLAGEPLRIEVQSATDPASARTPVLIEGAVQEWSLGGVSPAA